MQQKNKQGNTRKEQQAQLAQLSGAMGAVYNEIGAIKNHLFGMESIIMHFSDFLGKKEEFEKFLEGKVKEQKKEQEKLLKEKEEKEAEKSKDKEDYKGQKDDTYR